VDLLSAPPSASGRRRGIVQSPTGTGKSRVMRALAYHLIARRRQVVLAMPTEEILVQQADDVRRETRIPFYVDKAERRAPSYALITLASHQTLWRRLDRYDAGAVLLFDECHHSGRPARCNLSSLNKFRDAIGFSASPWSEECEVIYQGRVLYRYTLSQAISDGHLCSYELWPFPDIVPRPIRHELYYCTDNETARQLAAACPGSAYLGHDSPDRARLVEDFRRGVLRRLYLNMMLIEGFDCRDVSTIYLDKQTESDTLLYQIMGRGLRKKADGRALVVYCRDVVALRCALARAG
jgi:superfamily II DNA or RNA helicase